MKIGIFDPYLDTLGGGEKYILTIAEYLSLKNKVEIFWQNREIKNSAEKRFGLNLNKVQFLANIFSRKISFFKRLIITSKYDLLIILSDGSIPFTLAKKTFLHFQNPIERNKLSFLEKLKLSRIAGIICNSLYTKAYIDRQFGVKSFVLYPPVDVEKFFKIKIAKRNLILTVGRYNRLPDGTDFKKLSVLIEAFREISSDLSDWELVIVTNFLSQEKDFVADLEKKIKGEKIKIYKDLDQADMLEIYGQAKIYWHAAGFGEDLEKYPERAEHFGISTVEAMAAGAVPVVINLGGQREIIENGDNGFLWQTISELQEKTVNLAKDEKLWKKFSENARESSKHFNKERFCRELLSLTGKL